MTRAEEVVARARALVGVRFRAQGRSAAEGLDCIGLVAAALALPAVRSNYELRGGSRDAVEAGLAAAGLRQADAAAPGDVVLYAAGPAQLHLGIRTSDGIVHADASLRRVVERPGGLDHPELSNWRVEA